MGCGKSKPAEAGGSEVRHHAADEGFRREGFGGGEVSGQRPCAVLMPRSGRKKTGWGRFWSVSVELRYQVLELFQSELARVGADSFQHFSVVYQVVGHGPFAEPSLGFPLEV